MAQGIGVKPDACVRRGDWFRRGPVGCPVAGGWFGIDLAENAIEGSKGIADDTTRRSEGVHRYPRGGTSYPVLELDLASVVEAALARRLFEVVDDDTKIDVVDVSVKTLTHDWNVGRQFRRDISRRSEAARPRDDLFAKLRAFANDQLELVEVVFAVNVLKGGLTNKKGLAAVNEAFDRPFADAKNNLNRICRK
ncbi:hypothetical protein MESS4_510089 [Mesorhizobium sp. STM 4661]|nr:hypothetical protein MESS4_510089 [Mesorhizobium sp. STM 4661]